MKTLIVLVLAAFWGGVAAASSAAEIPTALAGVHKVYLVPMAGGLDQYLAETLTREGAFTVVVDPKQADAIWSERVDPAFLDTLKDLYPPPAPIVKAEKKDATKDATEVQVEPPHKRSIGGGRGNVFLVSVGSRQVLWSTYLNLQDRSPKAMHRSAQEIVKQLKKDMAGTTKE